MAGRRRPGREKRAASAAEVEDDGSGLVPMELDDGEVKTRSAELVDWLVKRHQLEDKKREQVAKLNAEIKITRDRIRVLTRECDERVAYVDPQMTLGYAGNGATNDQQASAAAS